MARYQIKKYNTWESIAKAHGISVRQLVQANPSVSQLFPGSYIVVPSGPPPRQPTQPPPPVTVRVSEPPTYLHPRADRQYRPVVVHPPRVPPRYRPTRPAQPTGVSVMGPGIGQAQNNTIATMGPGGVGINPARQMTQPVGQWRNPQATVQKPTTTQPHLGTYQALTTPQEIWLHNQPGWKFQNWTQGANTWISNLLKRGVTPVNIAMGPAITAAFTQPPFSLEQARAYIAEYNRSYQNIFPPPPPPSPALMGPALGQTGYYPIGYYPPHEPTNPKLYGENPWETPQLVQAYEFVEPGETGEAGYGYGGGWGYGGGGGAYPEYPQTVYGAPGQANPEFYATRSVAARQADISSSFGLVHWRI